MDVVLKLIIWDGDKFIGVRSYVCLKIKAHINLKEISFSDQEVLSNYFGANLGASLDNYFVSSINPSADFFNSENLSQPKIKERFK
jgi:hypothetical protein